MPRVKYRAGPTKLMAMTAAHFPLLPLTWEEGREAKSVHAETDIDTWTEASVSSSACCPVLSSDHRRFVLKVFIAFKRDPICRVCLVTVISIG